MITRWGSIFVTLEERIDSRFTYSTTEISGTRLPVYLYVWLQDTYSAHPPTGGLNFDGSDDRLLPKNWTLVA